MQRITLRILGTVLAVVLSGCAAPLKSGYPGLGGDPKAVVREQGQTKLLVFNATNRYLFPLNNQMDIWLNDIPVGSPESGLFVQVAVPSGKHRLRLRHIDVVPFVTEHDLVLEGPAVYLEVWATPLSNGLTVHTTLPPPSQLPRPFAPAPQ